MELCPACKERIDEEHPTRECKACGQHYEPEEPDY